jgi:FtsP/CotA-like multicopper oxidase with cupredoxin domain
MTIRNTSGQVHPMHLHGHHVVVLSRNGVAATGSPWWTDSLNVEDDETYEVAFVADNPGIWMDHCHNLPHAAQGLITHLMYSGVTTKFHLGGPTSNQPE